MKDDTLTGSSPDSLSLEAEGLTYIFPNSHVRPLRSQMSDLLSALRTCGLAFSCSRTCSIICCWDPRPQFYIFEKALIHTPIFYTSVCYRLKFFICIYRVFHPHSVFPSMGSSPPLFWGDEVTNKPFCVTSPSAFWVRYCHLLSHRRLYQRNI